MILLTDEEMRTICYGDGLRDNVTCEIPMVVPYTAKAQLKKVVELLKACDGELVSRKEGPFMATFEMLATDYQALLEEATK